jgi:hypothetical protein
MQRKIRTLKTLRKGQGKPQGAAPEENPRPTLVICFKGEGGAPEGKRVRELATWVEERGRVWRS